jgi:pimeloyl-ACP methyl ester carboxylesterase
LIGLRLLILTGNSGAGLVPFCDLGFFNYQPDLTCYIMDYRGIGYSWPLQICDKQLPYYINPWDKTVLAGLKDCMTQIINKNSEKLPYINNYYSAIDAQRIIDMTRSSGSTVSILGISYGTHFVNTLMNMPGIKADIIVLDGAITAVCLVLYLLRTNN